MYMNVFGLVHDIDQQKTENAEQEARHGVQGHVPPPETVVVVVYLAQKQGRKYKADCGQLQLRRDMNAKTALKQNRQQSDQDDHAGQKAGEPALAQNGQYGLQQQNQLQRYGDALMGDTNPHCISRFRSRNDHHILTKIGMWPDPGMGLRSTCCSMLFFSMESGRVTTVYLRSLPFLHSYPAGGELPSGARSGTSHSAQR